MAKNEISIDIPFLSKYEPYFGPGILGLHPLGPLRNFLWFMLRSQFKEEKETEEERERRIREQRELERRKAEHERIHSVFDASA